MRKTEYLSREYAAASKKFSRQVSGSGKGKPRTRRKRGRRNNRNTNGGSGRYQSNMIIGKSFLTSGGVSSYAQLIII